MWELSFIVCHWSDPHPCLYREFSESPPDPQLPVNIRIEEIRSKMDRENLENLENFRRPEVDMRNDLPKEPDGLGKLS
jgi:hypothetical protein